MLSALCLPSTVTTNLEEMHRQSVQVRVVMDLNLLSLRSCLIILCSSPKTCASVLWA